MDNVEFRFCIGIEMALLCILDRDRGADKDFAEVLCIEGAGDAIGGGGVVKKLLMELTNFLFGDKVEGYLVRWSS